MVLTKGFYFWFHFIIEVNIVCKIREVFFMLNFKSPFLIVGIVAKLYLLVLQNFVVKDNASF